MPESVYDRALQAVPDLQAQAHLTLCHGEMPATLPHVLTFLDTIYARRRDNVNKEVRACALDFNSGNPARAAGFFARAFGLPVGSRKCTSDRVYNLD